MPRTTLAPEGVAPLAQSEGLALTSAAEQPILAGLYPDPTVCQVDGTYYLATSSFEYFPAAPIWRSEDLRSWEQIGHVLTRRSQFPVGDGGPSKGIYGSTLRHHGGRFWFITTNAGRYDDGQVLVHATDPAGPWSEPVPIPDAIGIDPDLVWDGDVCYLTWKQLSFTEGDIGLVQAVVDLDTGRIGPIYPIWQGTGMTAPEGPHLYQVGEFWYLLLAEGGTERGHTVTVARSRKPSGPFEAAPQNPLLTHRSTGAAVQNTGHADLVQGSDGSWAAVYLGVRARGSIPGFHVLGRETFLAGIVWEDDWPVFDEQRYLLEEPDHSFEDHFDGPDLDLRWVVADGDPAQLVTPLEAGGLGFASRWRDGSDLLCARVRDLRWTAEVGVVGDAVAVLRIDDRHWYAVVAKDGSVSAQAQVGDLTQTWTSVPVSTPATLVISAVSPSTLPVPLGHAGPDEIVLAVDVDGRVSELARLDGRYLSSEVASGFTGRMLGVGTTGDGGVFFVHYRTLSD